MFTAGRPQRLDCLKGQRSLSPRGRAKLPKSPDLGLRNVTKYSTFDFWGIHFLLAVSFSIRLVSLFSDQESLSSLFHHRKSATTSFEKNTSLKWKHIKTVKIFKKHQRLKDHRNWVLFWQWPTLVAPRQSLATQWVALATVLKKWLQRLEQTWRKIQSRHCLQHQLTHLNSIQAETVGKPWILCFSCQKC